jgi:hypothetical protein
MLKRLILAAAVLTAPCAALAQATPCEGPEHRQFDFWIGRWDVTDTKTGAPAGQSVIERLYDGCALRENWSEPGFTGGSLNAYDPSAAQWRQTWTDSAGAWREFVGGLADGRMVLTARTLSRRTPGQTVLVRMAFTPNADGSVRQYSDISADGGATWTARYDYTYRRAATR